MNWATPRQLGNLRQRVTADLIADDQVRHCKHFYRCFQNYSARERTNRVAVGRSGGV